MQNVEEYRPRFPPEPIPNQPPHHGYPTHARLPPGQLRDTHHQPVYREQFTEQDHPQRQTIPHQQSLDHQTIPRNHPHQQLDQHRGQEHSQLPEWSNPMNALQTDQRHEINRPDPDDDDDSRTVIMAPVQSRIDAQPDQQDFDQPPEQLTSTFDHQEDQEQHNVRFHPDNEQSHQGFEETTENEPEAMAFDEDRGQTLDEDHHHRKQSEGNLLRKQSDGNLIRKQSEDNFQMIHPQQQLEDNFPQQHEDLFQMDHHPQNPEEHFHRKESIRPMTQILSTDDSGAPMSRDRLGAEDTDLFDSRETHEESDRLGPRTTEDEVSRTEDQNPPTDGEDEDSDSGIGKDGTALRLKKSNLMEKKSLFTIAYDGMQTRGLKSAGERDDSP